MSTTISEYRVFLSSKPFSLDEDSEMAVLKEKFHSNDHQDSFKLICNEYDEELLEDYEHILNESQSLNDGEIFDEIMKVWLSKAPYVLIILGPVDNYYQRSYRLIHSE